MEAYALEQEAMSRVRTAENWCRRLTELTTEYRQADERARCLLSHAVRALGELKEAAEAPVREAPRYYRESRPLPFDPSLIVEELLVALRRQGIRIDLNRIGTIMTNGGEDHDT